MTSQFILYSREGCHLCEDMIEQLQPYCEKYNFNIEIIDVDRTPQLQQKYGLSVPILYYQQADKNEEICKYFLEPNSLLSFLT
ncbi:MAG: glutaredoxin family protein [Pseudomonadota bacterium]